MTTTMKPKREKIPQTDVLDWLQTHHPALHATAAVDRSWVWITENIKADEAARKSVKDYGFRFAKNGHPIGSRVAYWGHACDRPMPFHRHKKGGGTKPTTTTPEQAEEENPLAFMGL